MRNLKKILALVLSLMMVLSVMVTASATDFADDADITNKEAVEVMSALGILSGSQGKFAPQGTLERAQAAKIIAFIKLGADADALLKGTGSTKFEDVTSGWAYDYISYCAGEGIVSGSQGKFFPKNTLTGYEFGKMVLNAAGVEGTYTGSQWKINVATALKKAGLLTDLDGLVLSANITREQAAQLAWNAMNYVPGGNAKEYVVTKGDEELYRGTDATTALLMKASETGTTLKLEPTNTGSIADVVYNVKQSSKTDAFGRTSTTYVDKDNAKKVYASFAATPVLTYTTAVNPVKIATTLGATTSEGVELTVITNGRPAAAETVKRGETKTDIGGQGTLVEVYKTAAGKYNVVVIETFVKKLGKNDVVAAKPATTSEDAKAAHVVLETGLTYDTTAFKAGDVVLYTKSTENGTDYSVVNVVKADSSVGKITATAADYFRVDGAKVVKSAHAKYTSTATTPVANSEWNGTNSPIVANATQAVSFFYDNYGNVIYAERGAAAAATVEDQYIYVLASAASVTKDGDGLFDEGNTDALAQAKVLNLETGKVEVVDLAVVKNTAGQPVYATRTGAASAKTVTTTNGPTDSVFSVGLHKFVKLENGTYAIETGAAETGESITLEKGSAKADNYYLTAKTVLTVVDYTLDSTGAITGATVTNATGYANFADATYAGAIVTADDSNFVSSILVVKAKADVTTAANYAFYKGVGETDVDGKTYYEFYVNGEVVSYVDNDGKYDGSNAWATGKVYDLTVNATAGTVTGVEKTAEVTGTVKAVESEYMLVDQGGTTKLVYFASAYTVVDGTTKAITEFAVGDTVACYSSKTVSANVLEAVDFIVVG